MRFVVPSGTTRVVDAPICNTTDVCLIKIADQFRMDVSMWQRSCPECPDECLSVRFETRLSSLTLSTDGIRDGIKRFVESSDVPLPTNWSGIWPAEIQKNFVKLTVQCESLSVMYYNQTPSISPVDLLSNVGGQTGLWIGISFLSLMELVEMAYRLVRHQYRVIRQKIHPTE